MTNNAHRTAISRKELPLPTQYLLSEGYLDGHSVLDYGCGKCHDLNNEFFDSDGFDPFYRPSGITGLYKVIICNYVLCVLPTENERLNVLRDIQAHLFADGVAYISVRNDKPKKGHGWSNSGTYQAWVELDLPLINKTQQFRIYQLTKFDIL